MVDSASDELRRRIAAYPEGAHRFFQSAFALATTLTVEDLDHVLNIFVSNFARGRRNVDGAELKAIKNLGVRDAQQLASAFSLVIGLLSESNASPEDFVTEARDSLYASVDEPVARTIATSICDRRGELGDSIERAQLAGSILPSLTIFEVAVDARLRIEEGKIKRFAPIVVVHIDTDAEGGELFLQLSQADLEDTIKTLSNALSDIKIASNLISEDC